MLCTAVLVSAFIPELLLLDEPTSALDLKWQLAVINAVREILRETGAIAMIAIHDNNLAIRTCDQLAVIADGALIAFGPTETIISPEVISRAYGVSARVEYCSEGIPLFWLIMQGRKHSEACGCNSAGRTIRTRFSIANFGGRGINLTVVRQVNHRFAWVSQEPMACSRGAFTR
jgi:ABC-type sulfate/molybdate transport systems ATPase subunit